MIGLLMVIGCDEGVGFGGITSLGASEETAETGGNTESDPGATWYRDVQPILQDNCFGCHGDEAVSFSLEEYSIASAMAGPIAAATASGTMPPWPADETDCLPLQDRRELSEDQIATLAEWSELGAPEGDPADAPGFDTSSDDGIEMDVWAEMAEGYTPDATVSDDYRCFVVDIGLEDDMFVTDAAVFPGNYGVVHHVILYTDPGDNAAALDAAEEGDGYTCYGGPGFDDTAVIGGWVPGATGSMMPEGAGLQLTAGTKIVLQMHYNADGSEGPDQTAFALDLEESVDTQVYLFPMADTNLNIPAGAEDHGEGWSTTIDYGINFRLWGGTPHMHTLGKSIKVSITPPDGEEQCVINIPSWDFDYQQFYRLEEAYSVENGSTLSLECVYDNPTDSEVNWGDGTEEEMCLVYAMLSL